MLDKIKSAFLGLSVGDALGVPFEFKSRLEMKKNPAKEMIGFGTHNQPAGTWSDDSSLTFCLAESLSSGYSISDIAQKFVFWKEKAYWTAHNQVFDIGISTSKAIEKLKSGINPVEAGGYDEYSNGNGSLMRILPLAFYVKNKNYIEKLEFIKEVSSLTHRHLRSVLACFIFIEFAILLINNKDKYSAYKKLKTQIEELKNFKPEYNTEFQHFKNILKEDISNFSENKIRGSGYVVQSLEAVFWCLLKNNNFENTVLAAVNLGEDTDTTASIVGGLAGIIYGKKQIKKIWLEKLARFDDIERLAEKFAATLK